MPKDHQSGSTQRHFWEISLKLMNEDIIEPLKGINLETLPGTKATGQGYKIPNQTVKQIVLYSEK
jgi:hypothetical protein